MDELTDKLIVLFDGVCNLCNDAVRFIIRHDAKDRFRFASLQSDTARQLLENHPSPVQKTDSIVLIENGKVYIKSGAVLRISRRLNGLWKLLVIGYIIPRFIRNAMYDLIARSRYKWFEKREECMMPGAELRHKFLA
ncbi:MAG: thiol-disulfide oxidoreductase DCC family protein [Chitinophagaceae bacterium]|nr:thiol-disulfide oxidoreductase DCC family protein [Chitinophagaceae bacterium]